VASPAGKLPPLPVIVLNRMAYGPRPGDLAAFESLAGTDEARLEAYVEQQLHPESIDDADLEARLIAAGFTTLDKTPAQLWADHYDNDPDWYTRLLPIIETERAAFLRALYSRRQLLEVLVEHWHDHFNVYGWDYIAAPTWVQYDRDAIRANVLGNFRDMLGAVATSPAMLVYLDNWVNHVAGPNENWARELFELHTLGAASYLGVKRQNEVPPGSGGLPVGYVDDDVYEATRCFTGWTLDKETGTVLYRADWHDRFQKWVLGTYVPPNQTAQADGDTVLELVARHPGTARHVATRLARRLISDDPPAVVVDAAAAAFLDNLDAPDQLRHVVRAILLSASFRSTWGGKVKRPFEVVTSALRAVDAELSFALDDDFTDSFLWLFEQTGHEHFAWNPPDGYPDIKEDWLGAGGMVACWRLLNWMTDVGDGNDGHLLDLSPPEAAGTSASALADWWIGRIYGREMPAAFRDEVIEFMAQGRGHDLPLPVHSDDDAEHRLRAMVGLLLIAPEFLWR